MSKHDCDFMVVGPGCGGSASACRLSQKGYKILVLEQEWCWTPENLPNPSLTITALAGRAMSFIPAKQAIEMKEAA